MYYYQIGYQDWDAFEEMTFASQTQYTKEEFDKIVDGAYEAMYQHIYKTSITPRCLENVELSDIFAETLDGRDKVFLNYLLENSDLELVKPGIYYDCDRSPQFDKSKLKNCKESCWKVDDNRYQFGRCCFRSKAISAGEKTIEARKNLLRTYEKLGDLKSAKYVEEDIEFLKYKMEYIKKGDDENIRMPR